MVVKNTVDTRARASAGQGSGDDDQSNGGKNNRGVAGQSQRDVSSRKRRRQDDSDEERDPDDDEEETAAIEGQESTQQAPSNPTQGPAQNASRARKKPVAIAPQPTPTPAPATAPARPSHDPHKTYQNRLSGPGLLWYVGDIRLNPYSGEWGINEQAKDGASYGRYLGVGKSNPQVTWRADARKAVPPEILVDKVVKPAERGIRNPEPPNPTQWIQNHRDLLIDVPPQTYTCPQDHIDRCAREIQERLARERRPQPTGQSMLPPPRPQPRVAPQSQQAQNTTRRGYPERQSGPPSDTGRSSSQSGGRQATPSGRYVESPVTGGQRNVQQRGSPAIPQRYSAEQEDHRGRLPPAPFITVEGILYMKAPVGVDVALDNVWHLAMQEQERRHRELEAQRPYPPRVQQHDRSVYGQASMYTQGEDDVPTLSGTGSLQYRRSGGIRQDPHNAPGFEPPSASSFGAGVRRQEGVTRPLPEFEETPTSRDNSEYERAVYDDRYHRNFFEGGFDGTTEEDDHRSSKRRKTDPPAAKKNK